MSEITQDQVEHELISTSLEVETLDTNLFRSRSLRMPPRGRGVFGGQVISQAVVSATNCVDPVYGLHVSRESNIFHQLLYSPNHFYSHFMYGRFFLLLGLSDISTDTDSVTSC